MSIHGKLDSFLLLGLFVVVVVGGLLLAMYRVRRSHPQTHAAHQEVAADKAQISIGAERPSAIAETGLGRISVWHSDGRLVIQLLDLSILTDLDLLVNDDGLLYVKGHVIDGISRSLFKASKSAYSLEHCPRTWQGTADAFVVTSYAPQESEVFLIADALKQAVPLWLDNHRLE